MMNGGKKRGENRRLHQKRLGQLSKGQHERPHSRIVLDLGGETNQTSIKRQSNVNETSIKRQSNVNETSNGSNHDNKKGGKSRGET